MPDTHQDHTAARRGALYLSLAAGTVPLIVSAVHGTHWDTYVRWYVLPTALIVLARFYFGWFRSLVGRVIGAGAFYLTVAALCSAVIAWWNHLVFAAVAALGVLLVILLGRHAIHLLAALGSEGVARVTRAWSRWQAEREQRRAGGVESTEPAAGASLDSSQPDSPGEENEPDPGEGVSSDRESETMADGHAAPRSRLGRLAEP